MSDKDLKLAKQAIETILQELSITQVVYVDDVFAEKQNVGTVIGWFAEALQKAPDEVRKLAVGIPFDAPYEVWSRALQERWHQLDADRRKEIAVRLSEILNTPLAQDVQLASELRKFFPEGMPFLELSPSAWLENEKVILANASAESRALCLFDQDLSYADGFTSTGSRSGIGLLRNVASDKVVCGLLTHTIVSIEDEMPSWRSLAEENEIGLKQFLPLAKMRLEDPVKFADGIKKTTLNISCEEMKETAIDIIGKAHKEAAKQLLEIDVYDFEYMVLRASRAEGVWEADTLIRLFQIFQWDGIRQLMLDSEISRAFNEAVEVARPISAVSTEQNEISHPWKVRRVRRNELYEDVHLTRHSPLQTGDLFELRIDGESHRKFILLAQPCDLMVRKDGTRSCDDGIVPLVPIDDKITYKSATREKSSYWRTRAPMYYFHPDSDDVAILAFTATCWVSIDILDLAVLDEEGVCRLKLDEEVPLPLQLPSGWRIHIERLLEKFVAHRARLDKLLGSLEAIGDESVRKTLWQSVMPKPSLTDCGFPREPYSNGIFDFGLRRVARYRRPGADKLLKAYTQYLSRDAEEPDFARPGLPSG